MPKVVWSKKAKETLLDCHDFIAEDSKSRAESWANKVIDSTQNLEIFPEMGVEENPSGIQNLRKLIIGDYILRYLVIKDEVRILSVKHSSTVK